MKYAVYFTPDGFDPRLMAGDIPSARDSCETEDAAVAVMRRHHEDGVALLVKTRTGELVMGVVPDATAAVNATGSTRVPFVMIIRAVSDGSWADKKAIRKDRAFTREKWAVPQVKKPYRVLRVDKAKVCVMAEGFPAKRDVVWGEDEKGRSMMFCEALPGNPISFTFDMDPQREAAAAIRTLEADLKVMRTAAAFFRSCARAGENPDTPEGLAMSEILST